MGKDIIVQTLRIPKDIHELVQHISDNRTETVSTFIRRAILKELASLGYLTVDERKSLGLKEDEKEPAGVEGKNE